MATFVLIHGSYQGGWIWKLVAARLRAAGHAAYAPSLDGCGERADQCRPGITAGTQAEEVAGFLRFEDLADVVLVGTSSGGMVVARTAELERPRIKRLVFVDALALMPGERIRDIVPASGQVETEHAAGPTREQRLERFLRDMDAELAQWAAERTTLHPIGVSTEPVVLDRFWDQDWDASVVCCLRAAKPGEAHQRRTAEKLGARWHELGTGHFPMLSMPDELTRILVEG